MVPRSQKILPMAAWTWIFLLFEYHSFITSIVLYYMVCFSIIPHCCLLSSPSAIGITFYLFVSAGTVGMLHWLCVSAGGSRYRGSEMAREKERVSPQCSCLHCWVGRWYCGNAEHTVKLCHCLTPAWGKRTCFMPSISLNCFHVRIFIWCIALCAWSPRNFWIDLHLWSFRSYVETN